MISEQCQSISSIPTKVWNGFEIGRYDHITQEITASSTALRKWARHYDTGSATGHYTVEVEGGGGQLHTHQVITGDTTTTVFNEGQANIMRGDPILREQEIPLTDAKSAMEYQQSQIGKELGKYDERTNSCVDHVANVLRANGEDIGSGPMQQMRYLRSQGFQIKVR